MWPVLLLIALVVGVVALALALWPSPDGLLRIERSPSASAGAKVCCGCGRWLALRVRRVGDGSDA